MSVFSYAKPRAVGEALRLLKNGTAALAGGTDLITLIRGGIASPDVLVDLTGGELGDDYLRFLENRLRQAHDFTGNPIRFSKRTRQPRSRQ